MRLKIILVGVSLASVPAASMAQDQLQYRYDAQGRLVRAARGPVGSTFGTVTTYTYDDADNRRQRVVTFGSLAALTLEPLGLAQIRLDAAYHQQITNAFRQILPYGGSYTPAQVRTAMQAVYTRFPVF